MSLESGKYYVTSAYGGFPIGRKNEPDKSRNPRGIYKLPLGTKSVWDVEKLVDGNYRLKNAEPDSDFGNIVGGMDRLLFAFQVDPEPDYSPEWTFSADKTRAQEGDAYMIADAQGEHNEGWAVPEPDDSEPYQQIILKTLIIGPSDPPYFPAVQVFFFKKVDA